MHPMIKRNRNSEKRIQQTEEVIVRIDEGGNAYCIELIFDHRGLMSKLKAMETTDTTLEEAQG